MLPFVALPPMPPLLAQVLTLPAKPVKPGLGGKAIVKFRVSQSNRIAERLRFFAFYPDKTGKSPGKPFPQVAFLPEELLVPPGGRTKTARATFDLEGLQQEQKIYVCAKTVPKVNTLPQAVDKPTGVATLSVLSCWPLRLAPGKAEAEQ